ncbi:hypothetical protein [Streptomyces sp. NPDC059063]|uniref:hypothetical protein n=1 Tax=unclassified Streptomyces TaxID=2593676 RepID=UPI003682910E
MTSARRLMAAVSLAAGAAALAVPSAHAAADTPAASKLNPVTVLDDLGRAPIPAEHQDRLPTVAGQLNGLNQLNELNQLHQVTDLVAPVTGLVPAVQ